MTDRGVLFVGNFVSGGSARRHYCEDLSEHVEAAGWRVTRTSSKTGRAARIADMLRTAWSRRRDYELAHIDLYSGAAFVWAEAVGFALRRLGKPFVITLHGGNLPEHARKWPKRTRRLLASATVVTSPSEYLRDALADYAPAIEVIPNGVDLTRYRLTPSDVTRARLLWLRAFHGVYNPVLAVDVVARLAEATLVMVGADMGDGSLAATRARARELGVEDRVRIVGGVPHREVAGYLAEADVFLNTADVDNTPVSVLEAMATGLRVISTNVGGVPYLLEHERSALLVPPRDAAAMASAVQRVLVDDQLAARIAKGARTRAEAHGWPRVIEQWSELFARVARA